MPPSYPQSRPLRYVRLLVVLIVLLVTVWLGLFIHHVLSFHVVKTDPPLSQVGNYSPFVRLYFNRELKDATITSSSLTTTTVRQGKVLTVNISSTMQVGKKYSFVLKSVQAADGSTISNQTFSFEAKNIAVTSLSKEAQQVLASRQDHYPYTVSYVGFKNFDALLDYGVPETPLQQIKQSIYDYSLTVKQEFWNVSLDPKTISVPPYNPNSADTSDSVDFVATLGSSGNYKIDARYDALADNLTQLRIYTPSGALLYDTLAAHD